MKARTVYFFGLTFLKLILKRLFTWENQEKLLRDEFKDEGIFSICRDDRIKYPELATCINCGFCEADLPINSTMFQHPEVLFNSLTTNLTDIIHEKEGAVEIKNFRCPAGAPYMELLNFISNSSKT